MRKVSEVEDLKLAVQMGRAAVLKHRQILTDLRNMVADDADIERARSRLEAIEEVHAEDLAELERLTAN